MNTNAMLYLGEILKKTSKIKGGGNIKKIQKKTKPVVESRDSMNSSVASPSRPLIL